jgi:hypothetical protein
VTRTAAGARLAEPLRPESSASREAGPPVAGRAGAARGWLRGRGTLVERRALGPAKQGRGVAGEGQAAALLGGEERGMEGSRAGGQQGADGGREVGGWEGEGCSGCRGGEKKPKPRLIPCWNRNPCP